MRYKAAFLVGLALGLSACADTSWPGQYELNQPPSASDYPVVKKRYEAASKKILGNAKDLEEIKQAIRESHPEMEISEIRWISATEVIAYTEAGKNLPLGYESFFCALGKKEQKWRFIACYLALVS